MYRAEIEMLMSLLTGKSDSIDNVNIGSGFKDSGSTGDEFNGGSSVDIGGGKNSKDVDYKLLFEQSLQELKQLEKEDSDRWYKKLEVRAVKGVEALK